MYHALPEAVLPSPKRSPVSSAPQSLPFAYITCCMRLSFDGSRASAAVNPAAAPTSGRHVASLIHVARGTSPAFCGTEPGTPYVAASTSELVSCTAGTAESSE